MQKESSDCGIGSDARSLRGRIYVVQIFCQSPVCNARQATVVTNGDNPEPKSWRCPACGVQIKVYRKLPINVYEREQLDADARAKRLRNWR